MIVAPRGIHSAKPPKARALLEEMFPHYDETSRIELFVRGHVPGWTVHGYEAHGTGYEPWGEDEKARSTVT